jgi:urea transporter
MLKQILDRHWLLKATLNSYAQVFFSNHLGFAILLLLVTFLDINAGMAGLYSVLLANIIARVMGFSHEHINKGYYGFNVLLVGLGLGIYYAPSFPLYIIISFVTMLCLFISLAFEGVFSKYGLPYLSIPFLLAIWIVILASRQFQALEIESGDIFWINSAYELGGTTLVAWYEDVQSLGISQSWRMYFKSLGAIFFQYNIIAGIIIAIGLFIASRLSFLLSVIGFFSAYFYYQLIGADITELSYSYIGFNYILTAIAIGGYFIIPSWRSFLWVILLVPVISLLITSANALLVLFQLSVFSLPFNIVVILFIYVLKLRVHHAESLNLVSVQYDQPEKNRYRYLNYVERFWNEKFLPISLPFWGVWDVSQDHDGEHTHKGDWRHAWDFIIISDSEKTFKDSGTNVADYLCYKKPVLAVAEGKVEEIIDNIKDNKVGDVDLENNWGNTIIIKHAPYLYSKISHILKGSFKVKKGDSVKKGQLLAYCGNSGRSPEPHIHFQMQTTPYVGSKTLKYPLGHYIKTDKNGNRSLNSFSYPVTGDKLSNIEKTPLLYNAFRWIPGNELLFKYSLNEGEEKTLKWAVHTDAYNNAYLYDEESKSLAYFKQDDEWHQFRSFSGDKDSIIYKFYQLNYKLALTFDKSISIKDQYTLDEVKMGYWTWLQDLLCPFYTFIKARFRLDYIEMDQDLNPENIVLRSFAEIEFFGKSNRLAESEMGIDKNGISYWQYRSGKQNIRITRKDEA